MPRFNALQLVVARDSRRSRVMLPTSTDSSIDDVSTSVRLAASDLGELGLVGYLAADAVVDRAAQLLLELGHQRRALALQRVARVEEQLLLLAHVRLAGAVHEQVADAVQSSARRKSSGAEIARSRHSPRILDVSRGTARGAADSVLVAFSVQRV